jgi:alanyl-tRNA synthetase
VLQDAREDIDLTADDILSQVAQDVGKTMFIGYEHQVLDQVSVLSLVRQGKVVGSACEGETVDVVLAATPFYAESGGQVGDQGTLVVRFSPTFSCPAAHCSLVGGV